MSELRSSSSARWPKSVNCAYFIGPKGGGLEIQFEGEDIMVITPQSPLGQNLVGKKSGQRWTAKLGGLPVKYRVLNVS